MTPNVCSLSLQVKLPNNKRKRPSFSSFSYNWKRTFLLLSTFYLLSLSSNTNNAVYASTPKIRKSPSSTINNNNQHEATTNKPSKNKKNLVIQRQDHLQKQQQQLQKKKQKQQEQNSAFVEWCQTVGIKMTNVTIKTFHYEDLQQDYLSTYLWDNDDDFFQEQNKQHTNNESSNNNNRPRKMRVRGLAAAQDLPIGQVIISIPYDAMITVGTTIDADPVLSRVLGPRVRQKYNWEDDYSEMALLTIALLYHNALGRASPLFAYMEMLHQTSTVSFPFLWSKQKLHQDATEGIRTIARGIHKDIQDMYRNIFLVVAREFPQLFHHGSSFYSMEQFSWAFAMVNSRHWHVPIPDYNHSNNNNNTKVATSTTAPKSTTKNHHHHHQQHHYQFSTDPVVPPADQPTEEWVEHQQQENDSDNAIDDDDNESDNDNDNDTQREDLVPLVSHSFLAPVADLINFGPPCIQSFFDTTTASFELRTTCLFRQGQEVTYWYSNDCQDVVMANYGFTHPMVPPCPDWRLKWKQRVRDLELELEHLYQDIDRLDSALDQAQADLEDCNCQRNRNDDSSQQGQQQPPSREYVRGSYPTNNNNQQQEQQQERGGGVRRKHLPEADEDL